jgi:hypothetical protein
MARGSSQRRSTAAWRECARGFIAGGGCGEGPQVAVARFWRLPGLQGGLGGSPVHVDCY